MLCHRRFSNGFLLEKTFFLNMDKPISGTPLSWSWNVNKTNPAALIPNAIPLKRIFRKTRKKNQKEDLKKYNNIV